jgi:lipopolysaccharide export system protein LptA
MRAPLLLFACFVALAGAARAEKADREKEVVVGADYGTLNDADKTLLYEGNVVITQGTMRLTANKVTVKEDDKGHKFYVAYGAPVTFREKRDRVEEYVEGYALRAEFDDLNDVLKLYDKARVKSSSNEVTGNYIQYDMNTEVANVLGAPPGTEAPPNSRIKMTIVPAKKGDAAVPGKAPPAPPVSPALKPDAEPGTK